MRVSARLPVCVQSNDFLGDIVISGSNGVVMLYKPRSRREDDVSPCANLQCTSRHTSLSIESIETSWNRKNRNTVRLSRGAAETKTEPRLQESGSILT